MPIISTNRIASGDTGFLQLGLSVAVTLSLFSASASAMQQESKDQEAAANVAKKKVIHEPVHRVASNPNVAPTPKLDLLPNVPISENSAGDNVKSPEYKGDEANKTRNSVPTVLPKATTNPSSVPATNSSTILKTKVPPHPLDDALGMAHRGLLNMQDNIRDYSAIMIKRERVNGKLLKPEYMQMKIRSERIDDNGSHVPFSVYAKFIKPRACSGREVIWVKGHNENKLCAHEGTGILALKTVNLDPDGWIAMQGNRYPIYEAGMENLIVKLIEKAERDRAAGDCEVNYYDKKLNGRPCTLIEVVHPEERAPYDFHIAKVFIDKELKLPVRYQAYIWPKPGSDKPQLLEEYTYLNVKLNQGFTAQDFNPKNKAYNYPRR